MIYSSRSDCPAFDLLDTVSMSLDPVARFTAAALLQARDAADAMRAIVIPHLPAARRTFAMSLARRMELEQIFDEASCDDLDALIDLLQRSIEAGTHFGWEADENYADGGYKTVVHEPGIPEIMDAVDEPRRLRDTVLALIAVTKALRKASALLDE